MQGDTGAAKTLAKNITMTVSYANGTTKNTTNFVLNMSSVNVKKTGKQMLAVEYSEGAVKKTAMVPVEVVIKPVPVKKLTVKAVTKKKKVSIKLSWKKAAGERYELSFGTKKSQHKKLGTLKITKKTKMYSRTAKNFKKGKFYYFHIRTYSTVNGKKTYSKYKTVRAKIK